MAGNYLAIQGSSVPCERQFSSAWLVDTKQHNWLGSKKFGSIKYVKAYYKQEHQRHQDVNLEAGTSLKRLREETTLSAIDTNKHTRVEGVDN